MMCGASRARRAFVVPHANGPEAALVEGAHVYPARSLLEVCAHLSGRELLTRCTDKPAANDDPYPDLADVKGQPQTKRALEIAAAGGHSLIMVGPPGAGKTMLAMRLPGILPSMTQEQALESAAVQSLGTAGFDVRNWQRRPFRAPHDTASGVALVGGGGNPRPGEISMAMHGVLFLDEAAEFNRDVLEVLWQPLESGRISVSRAARQVEFPAEFQLVAAMNPCPCGYLGHYSGKCRCSPDQVVRYRRKISGPLLDRIDLQIEVPAVGDSDLLKTAQGEASAVIAARVATAYRRQLERQDKPNSKLSTREIDIHCVLNDAGVTMLKQAISRLGLSARAYHRILKVARTIADLAGCTSIASEQIAEAIQYRRFDASPR